MEPTETTHETEDTINTQKEAKDTRGPIALTLVRLCDTYQIGRPILYSMVKLDPEDTNFSFETDKGKYLARIFSTDRTVEDIKKETDITEKMISGGFPHPTLHKTRAGEVVATDPETKRNLLVMDFVEGESFSSLNRPPRWDEVARIAEQAALIHHTDYKPTDVKEKWAISNIVTLYKEASEKKHFPRNDLNLVKQAISMYQSIPLDELPHCLVHGALSKDNVLRRKFGEVTILNFSASNYLPRIHELAVMASDLLQDEILRNPVPLKVKTDYLVKLFNRIDPEQRITNEEKRFLHSYALAVAAISLMKGYSESQKIGKENRLFKLGHNILTKELPGINYRIAR